MKGWRKKRGMIFFIFRGLFARLCCGHCKTVLIAALIGGLLASIALAIVLTIYLKDQCKFIDLFNLLSFIFLLKQRQPQRQQQVREMN